MPLKTNDKSTFKFIELHPVTHTKNIWSDKESVASKIDKTSIQKAPGAENDSIECIREALTIVLNSYCDGISNFIYENYDYYQDKYGAELGDKLIFTTAYNLAKKKHEELNEISDEAKQNYLNGVHKYLIKHKLDMQQNYVDKHEKEILNSVARHRNAAKNPNLTPSEKDFHETKSKKIMKKWGDRVTGIERANGWKLEEDFQSGVLTGLTALGAGAATGALVGGPGGATGGAIISGLFNASAIKDAFMTGNNDALKDEHQNRDKNNVKPLPEEVVNESLARLGKAIKHVAFKDIGLGSSAFMAVQAASQYAMGNKPGAAGAAVVAGGLAGLSAKAIKDKYKKLSKDERYSSENRAMLKAKKKLVNENHDIKSLIHSYKNEHKKNMSDPNHKHMIDGDIGDFIAVANHINSNNIPAAKKHIMGMDNQPAKVLLKHLAKQGYGDR